MMHRLSLLIATLTPWFWLVPPSLASNLEQQLNIQPHNATSGQSRDVADQWMQLGKQQAAAGEFTQATQAWTEAADIYRILGDTQAQGQAYSAMGHAFVNLGNYTQAERAFRLRTTIARDNNDTLGVVFGLNNLGSLQVNQGRLNDGQALFEEALLLARPTGDARAIGLSLSNLGWVAFQQGDFDLAVELLTPAANYRLLAQDSLGEAHTSNHLGDAYLALGQDTSAIGAYRVGLRLGDEVGDRDVQLRALDGLLTIYFDRNELDTAKTFLDRRIALTLNQPEPDRQTAITLRWLGDYYAATGNRDSAQDAYQRGLALSRNLAIKSLEAEFSNRLLRV